MGATASSTASSTAGQLLVIAHETRAGERGVSALLRQLGAVVIEVDLFSAPEDSSIADTVRAAVIDAGARLDYAASALRRFRAALPDVPMLMATPIAQLSQLDPSMGFDDFIALPCPDAELYARIRRLEWHRSEFSHEERVKVGPLVIDRAAHDVQLHGRSITLTAKEYALLDFLMTHRGRLFSREALLSRVWGARYDGGSRTVDIHVRRLRAKLGDPFALETVRGAGYRLPLPKERI